MFQIKKGGTDLKKYPVTASTEFDAGALVAFSSGKLIPATSVSAKETIVGILPKAISSSDSDYADERFVSVIVPKEKNVEVEADVTSGLVAADVGLYQDLTSSTAVDRSASSVDVVQCVRVISSTKGVFRLNIGGAGA